jgi:hypothetical protein
VVSVRSFARLFPNDIALPPPACIWRMKKIQTPIRSSIGSQDMSRVMYQGLSSIGFAVIRIFLLRSVLTRSGSSGAYVRNDFFSFPALSVYFPLISCPLMMVTSITIPESTAASNSEKGISSYSTFCALKVLKRKTIARAMIIHRARFL